MSPSSSRTRSQEEPVPSLLVRNRIGEKRPPAKPMAPEAQSPARSPGSQDSSGSSSASEISDVRERMALMRRWMSEFSPADRLTAFQALQPHLGVPAYHWLASQLPHHDLHAFCPPGCQDVLRLLPEHLVLAIVSYLSPCDLARASQVCVFWRDTLTSAWIWRRLANLPQWRLSSAEHAAQLGRYRALHPNSPLPWKKIFRERFKLRRCWLRGQCHVRTFEGHTGGVSCIQFDQSRIVSGSHDKTIRVWNIKTNSPWSVMTLTGHSGEVRCLHLEGDRVASGSTDHTIKVWDLDIQPAWSSIACKVTMVGHQDTVRCIQMSNAKQRVISGSYDATLKVWCLKTGTCLSTLTGHEGRVLCLHWEGPLLLTGSSDKTLKMWDLDRLCCTGTLVGHSDGVTSISVEGNKIVSGSLDRTIKVWNLLTQTCLSTLDWMTSEGHTGVIRCLQADSWRIVSASDDKTLKVWNLETRERLVTLKSHTDGVTCLRFNDSVIVSGSYDKTVKLWDFTVC